MTMFYVIRHGETEWNGHGNRYCGRTDLPLTTVGKLQAAHLGNALAATRFDAALVSPLQRAQQTALGITQRVGIEMQTDSRLSEIDFGDWEGLTQQEIEHHFAQQWKAWLHDPAHVKAGGSGESAGDVVARIRSVFVENSRDNGDSVMVVSHNTAIRLFIAGTLGMPLIHYRKLEFNNAGICMVEMKSAADFKWQLGGYMPTP